MSTPAEIAEAIQREIQSSAMTLDNLKRLREKLEAAGEYGGLFREVANAINDCRRLQASLEQAAIELEAA